MNFLIIAIVALVAFIVFILANEKDRKRRMLNKIRESWGHVSERDYTVEQLENISHYFRRHEGEQPCVDDITWNDLDMDTIFMLLNQTFSSMGEEYLYHMLRTPEMDQEVLSERKRLTDFFGSHKKEREELQMLFARAGKSHGVSISKYIYRLHDYKMNSSLIHILSALAMLAAIVFAVFQPGAGIIIAVVVLAHNLMRYYKVKGEIEPYFISIKYLIRVINAADQMGKVKIPELETYMEKITGAAKKFRGFMRNANLVIGAGASSGSIEAVFMDYIRMFFHVDLIKFNSMVRELQKHIGDAETIIDTMGMLEGSIAVASFRQMMPVWCEPELRNQRDAFLDVKNVYHPMIKEPVANSAATERGAIITGSNASGKSTFLKTMAINAILAQSIYTCTATAYKGSFFTIYSSMALQDNLMAQESYFIVEIKSLKRIINAANGDLPVLCFVDEVLRGTNTVERISASAQILKSLCRRHVLCFAATHDIELTYLLEKHYDNFHFQEEIEDNDILFNYQIYKGRAVSRNAIKLLSIIGYDDQIIHKAEHTAANFMETGEWSL